MFLILLFSVAFIAIRLSYSGTFNALLFLIPLSVYSQSSTVISLGTRGVNLGMDTIYIFVFIIMECAKGNKNKFGINGNKSSFAISLCFGYLFLNALVSSLVAASGFSISGLVVYVRLFQYVPIFIFLYNIRIDFKQSIKVIKVFIWTGISGAILAFYQLLSGNYNYMKGMPSFTMPIFREEDASTDIGSYAGSGNYNVYAAFLIIAIFLTILIWYCRNEGVVLKKRSLLIYMFILIIGLYVANSRAALIAVVIGLIAMNFNRKQILSSLKALILIIVPILIIGFIFRENSFIQNITTIFSDFSVALPYAMENVTYDSSMEFSGDTMGAVTRVFGFSEAIRVFLHFPLFGCGFDLFLSQSIHYPENLFLQILAETGIIGFCLYVNFIYRIYVDAAKLPKTSNFNKYYIATFKGLVIALIFVNMTGATLLIQKVWGPLLIIAGCFYGYQRTSIKETIRGND